MLCFCLGNSKEPSSEEHVPCLLGTFIQTPTMCANRGTREQWDDCGIITLHGIQAYPKTSQLEQVSKTSSVCSEECQQSQSLILPWKSFQT